MNKKDQYVLGYGEGAMAWMTSRTVDGYGAFLLPYLRPGLSLLDCGCGPGNLTLGYAVCVHPGEVVGMDREAAQFAQAQKRAAAQGLDNVRFTEGDAYALPFDDGHFDIAFASALLGNLADPERVIAELVRVVKPGGRIALKEFDNGSDLIYPLSPPIQASLDLYLRSREAHGHTAEGGRQVRRWLVEAGCTIEHHHALFEQHTADDDLLPFVRRNNQLVDEILAAEYVEAGWATAEELQEQARAWEEFAEQPGAIYATAWVECIGRTPA